MNTPTLEEICKAHSNICHSNTPCHKKCPLAGCHNEAIASNYITCNAAFIKDVLTGKRNLDGSLTWNGEWSKVKTTAACTSDKNDPVKLPDWCKVGQWCFNEGGEVCRVESEARRVGEYVHATVFFPAEGKTVDQIIQCKGDEPFFKPVRFRGYRYEEAIDLLGKRIEYTSASRACIEIISCVSIDDDYGSISINKLTFFDWTELDATINGVPIGVPEADEEAMKEAK